MRFKFHVLVTFSILGQHHHFGSRRTCQRRKMVFSSSSRLWVDGCFDFVHHGHAGAMRQARALGAELYVGVHSDEEILRNKGPVVMTLEERMMAVEACKWCTKAIAGAPYVTDPAVMDSYGCEYVVHGDDITTDADGNDCYQTMKDLGRFIVVKRTPFISTTNLVQRLLEKTSDHFVTADEILEEHSGAPAGTGKARVPSADASSAVSAAAPSETLEDLNVSSIEMFRKYATGEDAVSPHSSVQIYSAKRKEIVSCVRGSDQMEATAKCIYVPGSFDLFSVGDIDFLRRVKAAAGSGTRVIAAVLSDGAASLQDKEGGFPVMNLIERTLCVLQCRYVDGVIVGAEPFDDDGYARALGGSQLDIQSIYKLGGTHLGGADRMGVPIIELNVSDYSSVNAQAIAARVMASRNKYEERQRKKGIKSAFEKQIEGVEIEGRV